MELRFECLIILIVAVQQVSRYSGGKYHRTSLREQILEYRLFKAEISRYDSKVLVSSLNPMHVSLKTNFTINFRLSRIRNQRIIREVMGP